MLHFCIQLMRQEPEEGKHHKSGKEWRQTISDTDN